MILIAFLVAAQITTIADPGNGPLGLTLDAAYSHLREDTRITRERSTPAGIVLGDELQHTRTLDELELRLAVAPLRDLELHIIAPYALRDLQEWYGLAGGTLATNTIDVSGCAAPGSCTTPQPIGVVPGQSTRSGFFDPSIGFIWRVVDGQRRGSPDPLPGSTPAATWVVGLDYTVPLGGKVDDPTRTVNATGRPEQRQAHVLTAWTAFSKRLKSIEPYLKVEGSAPIPTGKAYDNCQHPELLADVATANCAGAWKGDTGYRPPFEAALTGGAEIVAFEDPRQDRRFSFDLRLGVRWHGVSRGYTQVTDLLAKLTYADEYLTGVGQLAFYGRISRWLNVRVTGLLGMDTAHFLTHEDVGEDKNHDGFISISQGTGAPAPDQNPNYDFRLDQPGRRLRAEPSLFWGVSGTLSVSF